VLAAYLGLVFGVPAWGDYHALVASRETLRLAEGLPVGAPVHLPIRVLRELKLSETAWETYVRASEQLARDLGAFSVAVIALVLGLNGVLRGSRVASLGSDYRWGDRPRSSTGSWRSAAGTVWTPIETLGLAFLQVLLVAYVYIATTLLLAGEPPSVTLATNALDRTVDVLIGVIRMLQ
jgi:hypothetical protein